MSELKAFGENPLGDDREWALEQWQDKALRCEAGWSVCSRDCARIEGERDTERSRALWWEVEADAAIAHVKLLLPMAKGWAARYPVGRNQALCDDAAAFIAAIDAARQVCGACGQPWSGPCAQAMNYPDACIPIDAAGAAAKGE